jgi:hypothetical protein
VLSPTARFTTLAASRARCPLQTMDPGDPGRGDCESEKKKEHVHSLCEIGLQQKALAGPLSTPWLHEHAKNKPGICVVCLNAYMAIASSLYPACPGHSAPWTIVRHLPTYRQSKL